MQLPGGCFVRRCRDKLVIIAGSAEETTVPVDSIYGLKVPGKVCVGEMGLVVDSVCIEQPAEAGFAKQGNVGYFDYRKLKFPLKLRYRRNGDRFVPLGMRGRKKLQDFFVDEAVPAEQRDRVPLLTGNGEIVWVIDCENEGWGRIAENVKVTRQTKSILKVKVEPLT